MLDECKIPGKECELGCQRNVKFLISYGNLILRTKLHLKARDKSYFCLATMVNVLCVKLNYLERLNP